MSSEIRYVFDTTVIVSALLFNDSVPGKAFLQSFSRGAILVSESLLEELDDVLRRDKFNRYLTPGGA